jgi:orotate phosphoribosyltransferase
MNDRQFVLAHLKAYSMKVAAPGEWFKLASGGKSKLYVDAKRTVLSRQIHQPLAALLYEEIRAFGHVDAVAGVVLGGCHLASVVATYAAARNGELSYNVIFVRKTPKDHGTGHVVEQAWARYGEWVVLLEDVLSTGATAKHAVGALREAGFDVRGIVALLDRRPPDARTDHLEGVTLRSVYRLEDLELSKDDLAQVQES